MSNLLVDHEIMLNPALGAHALWAFTVGFHSQRNKWQRGPTLLHLLVALPLVYTKHSRQAINKRRLASGLRAILFRDRDLGLAQYEAVSFLSKRMVALEGRTLRSLNCALAWGLIHLADGYFYPQKDFTKPAGTTGDTLAILNAAEKLGKWAGQLGAAEYFNMLGVDLHYEDGDNDVDHLA